MASTGPAFTSRICRPHLLLLISASESTRLMRDSLRKQTGKSVDLPSPIHRYPRFPFIASEARACFFDAELTDEGRREARLRADGRITNLSAV